MTRMMVAWSALAAVGTALLVSTQRWSHRPSLLARMAPYLPGSGPTPQAGAGAAPGWRELLEPTASAIGDALAGALGVGTDLEQRLARASSPLDPAGHRFRQLAWAMGG